jgi:hypothetical protein
MPLRRQFLDPDNLPERIVFIGGGYVLFEFAHVAERAGILGVEAGCKPTDFRVSFGKFVRLAPAVGGGDRRPSMKGPER